MWNKLLILLAFSAALPRTAAACSPPGPDTLGGPFLNDLSPADGRLDVPADALLSALFYERVVSDPDEDLSGQSYAVFRVPNDATFILEGPDGPVELLRQAERHPGEASFRPAQPLEVGASYTFTVTTLHGYPYDFPEFDEPAREPEVQTHRTTFAVIAAEVVGVLEAQPTQAAQVEGVEAWCPGGRSFNQQADCSFCDQWEERAVNRLVVSRAFSFSTPSLLNGAVLDLVATWRIEGGEAQRFAWQTYLTSGGEMWSLSASLGTVEVDQPVEVCLEGRLLDARGGVHPVAAACAEAGEVAEPEPQPDGEAPAAEEGGCLAVPGAPALLPIPAMLLALALRRRRPGPVPPTRR